MKLLTLEDYEKAGESFWPKYWYVAKNLVKMPSEDILKVLESIGSCTETEDGRKGRSIWIQKKEN